MVFRGADAKCFYYCMAVKPHCGTFITMYKGSMHVWMQPLF